MSLLEYYVNSFDEYEDHLFSQDTWNTLDNMKFNCLDTTDKVFLQEGCSKRVLKDDEDEVVKIVGLL